ncbi:CTLH C-terminal LisH motif [Arabidopsis suecica]|uniref:CTLH C-terminal LisH motif n=1 Tax=Arabidopsis suecica TaxID=45249 RepID=A0A8T1XY16_ARASU|nr:CTLH C-terminal LisH motif [Arabidopsis suecica]
MRSNSKKCAWLYYYRNSISENATWHLLCGFGFSTHETKFHPQDKERSSIPPHVALYSEIAGRFSSPTREEPRKRETTMDSTTVNWEALDALIIDFVSSENLVEDAAAAAANSSPSPLSSPASSSSPSISSSSYHSRLIIRRIRNSIESGDIETAIDILRSHAPFVLDDHRILFRLQKQKFIELLRKGTHEAAIGCLRTCVAPCALDAYPEAYEEFKHVLLALIYDKNDQTSPVAHEWAEKRRYEMAGLMSSVLRASLQAYDPLFSMTLRYLISIHKGFCFHQGISSAVSDLTHRLLLEERDAPATPLESMYEIPPFDEVDIQALAHAVELTRQGAVDSMKFAKGDLFQAFQNELCRMRLDVSVLDELVKEYCIYRGIVDSERQMIKGPTKRNQSEVGRSLSRDCSLEIDLNTSQHSDSENYSNKIMLDGSFTNDTEMSCEQGGDVGTHYGSEPTSVCEDCSTSWSNQCENTRALLRIRSHMNSEGNKRKRWCGRTAEMDCLPRLSFAKSESGTNPVEDKYEIALALKELVSRGMAAEAVYEISTMDPNFFTQNPGLLFHLKQVEFLKLVSAGDHNGALKVACSHLGPIAANDQSLLKTLKETLLVLLQPDGTTPGKDLPLNDLANMLQVTMFFSFDLFFWFCLMNDQQTTGVCFCHSV